MVESALEITSGSELERFALGTFRFNGSDYEVLTGFETISNTCWWCGKDIVLGKREAHYCRRQSHHDYESCFRQYWQHFEWGSARNAALARADYRCENCGIRHALAVHHIVPLKGAKRFFSAFNLPWNLIVLCKTCHLEVHAIMAYRSVLTIWEKAERDGQLVMALQR